jgi:hypothetical protein
MPPSRGVRVTLLVAPRSEVPINPSERNAAQLRAWWAARLRGMGYRVDVEGAPRVSVVRRGAARLLRVEYALARGDAGDRAVAEEMAASPDADGAHPVHVGPRGGIVSIERAPPRGTTPALLDGAVVR